MFICTFFLQVLRPALCNRKQTPNSWKPGNFLHERHWSFNLGLITGTCITWCHLFLLANEETLGRDDDIILNSVNFRSVFDKIINCPVSTVFITCYFKFKRYKFCRTCPFWSHAHCHISSFFRFELILSGETLLTKNPYLVESRFWVSVCLSISLWGVKNRKEWTVNIMNRNKKMELS